MGLFDFFKKNKKNIDSLEQRAANFTSIDILFYHISFNKILSKEDYAFVHYAIHNVNPSEIESVGKFFTALKSHGIPFSLSYCDITQYSKEENEKIKNTLFRTAYMDLVNGNFLERDEHLEECFNVKPWTSSFRDDNGKFMESFYMDNLKEVKIGYYKFEFLNLSKSQNDLVCAIVDRMDKENSFNIMELALLFRNNRIAYTLKFTPVPDISMEENLKLYGTHFLPLYKQLLDNKILIQI